jgi:hypothetical protein
MFNSNSPDNEVLELDRSMLETMLSMFDTHATREGVLTVQFRGNVLTVEDPNTGRSDVLGATHLPSFMKTKKS